MLTTNEMCMHGKYSICIANEVYINEDGLTEIKVSQWENVAETKIIKEKILKRFWKLPTIMKLVK